MARVAINGFGRIGRCILRALTTSYKNENLEVVAINDLADLRTLHHLFKYDSNYGIFQGSSSIGENWLELNGHKITVLNVSNPKDLPWGDLGIDIVLECTGVFTSKEKSMVHLERGAKKVLVSAPCDGADFTMVYGVNHFKFNPKEHLVLSCASCTTNCLAPVVYVLERNFGVKNGFMTTAHAYTNDQRILDLPHKDLRRARAAGLSIIPTTTGAAKAVGKVLPDLNGRIDGLAFRVPVSVVSVVDFVCQVNRTVTKEQINEAFLKASEGELKGVLGTCREPLVSSDFKGSSFSSIVDLELTMVNGDLVKVISWYDNEWSFSCRMIDCAAFLV